MPVGACTFALVVIGQHHLILWSADTSFAAVAAGNIMLAPGVTVLWSVLPSK